MDQHEGQHRVASDVGEATEEAVLPRATKTAPRSGGDRFALVSRWDPERAPLGMR